MRGPEVEAVVGPKIPQSECPRLRPQLKRPPWRAGNKRYEIPAINARFQAVPNLGAVGASYLGSAVQYRTPTGGHGQSPDT